MKWSSPLSDDQILGVMSDEGRGLFRGCHWGKQTRHAVLDIDAPSKYHNALDLIDLTYRLTRVGLIVTPYQSSASGGWHLYLFFSDWADSHEVETTLKKWLKANRYEIKDGTLEVFPCGKALRLPMQPGFAWLDQDGNVVRRREEITKDEALASFLADLETNSRNWHEAKERIDCQISKGQDEHTNHAQERQKRLDTADFQPLYFPGIDWEKYRRGREYWEQGLTGPKQRHDAVLCIGHYLWYGDETAGMPARPFLKNASARAELITAWLQEKHNGHSRAVNSGAWSELKGEIIRACSWTSKGAQETKLEPYPLTERLLNRLCETRILSPDDYALANQRSEARARRKIADGLQEMLKAGKHPTIRGLAEITGCRRETIKKHADIWRIYAVRTETRMSTGLGDLNGGVGGIFSGHVLLAAGSCSGKSEEKNLSVLSVVESDCPGDSSLVLDSLRSETQRSDGEQLNGMTISGFPAATPFECSSGVKHWRTQCVQDQTVPCGINGNLPSSAEPPLGPLHLILGGLFVESSGRQSNSMSTGETKIARAGGVSLSSGLCYSGATKGSVKERKRATAGALSQSPSRPEITKNWTVSDATNSIILTITPNRIKSGFRDKLALIFSAQKQDFDSSFTAVYSCKQSIYGQYKTVCRSRAPPAQSLVLQ